MSSKVATRKPVKGEYYGYYGLFGNYYSVKVLKVGRFFSLCKWRVHAVDFGYKYTKVGFKANWRLMDE